MDAQKIFMNCGAATASLQMSVVTNYDRYKYWFKSTPYNEAFLITSCMKMTGTIANVLKGTLAATEAADAAYVKDAFKVSTAVDGKLRAHILMENAEWCAGMVVVAQAYLPTLVGLTVTGTTLVSPTASDITTELNAIKDLNPHIIFTAFSGSVGAVYSQNKADLGIPAVSIGINVPGQEDIHWGNTDGDCEGEIFLDTYAVGLGVTDKTASFFEDYEDRFGGYPVYTAATYDAILAVTAAMEGTGSLDPEDLIPWLEDLDNAFAGGTGAVLTAYYPMPDVTITEGVLYALSEDQVRAFYPDLAAYNEDDWQCGYLGGSPKGFIAHDTAYGPAYQTGVGSQWQEVDGEGVKVGIWPKYLGPAYDAALTDNYGNWNFQYPGTATLILPIGDMLNIPWDAYANAV
jgi:branched-chain amino acid transport system substrate-binding protein